MRNRPRIIPLRVPSLSPLSEEMAWKKGWVEERLQFYLKAGEHFTACCACLLRLQLLDLRTKVLHLLEHEADLVRQDRTRQGHEGYVEIAFRPPAPVESTHAETTGSILLEETQHRRQVRDIDVSTEAMRG